jgi:hypothetical protein
MLVSIQIASNDSWDRTQAVIHSVDSWEEAVGFCYMLSKQLDGTKIRIVQVDSFSESLERICRRSGTYITCTLSTEVMEQEN